MHPLPPRRRRRAAGVAAASALALLALAGCSSDQVARGYLPGDSANEVTDETGRILSLWVGSWIAALLVGIITWGLILWCVARYRKRKDDDVLPVQLRYHVPLEIMYVILPILMVGVLFYYTARDNHEIMSEDDPVDLNVQVVAKQWSWDFNYLDDGVYETGQQAQEVGAEGSLAEQVTLYLPVDERVQFTLNSRDVIHSFWIPAFLFKMDVFPGDTTNSFQVTPTKEGDYVGKCAELCGEYHASMLFNVKVVSREEYDAHMEELRDLGQTGSLGVDVSRVQSLDSVRRNGEAVEGTVGEEG
ncbi:cytochrome c oxidase subunit II [Cellulomonas endophytica]|uniref:aa3-type cytochrome oxidase subunit II n=1 Tax=Cellulomonas endophytica TaxID=2494735 RepID=UPI00101361E6|nr:cytochrome c oxidase subunit II [Cellulomonas endophytica]